MKHKLLNRKKLLQLVYCFSLMFLVAHTAVGQKTFTWGGATSTNWATPTNWATSGTSVAPTFFSSGVCTLNLTNANNDIDVGDVVPGTGIQAGTTITTIDGTKKIIGIRLPTK